MRWVVHFLGSYGSLCVLAGFLVGKYIGEATWFAFGLALAVNVTVESWAAMRRREAERSGRVKSRL